MTHYTKINEDALPYNKIKELDLESEKKMVEGKGPADECICNLLAPPDDKSGRGIGGTMKESIKRAIRTMSGSVKRRSLSGGGGAVGAGAAGGAIAVGGYGTRGSGSCVNPDCDGSVGRGGGIYIPLTTTKGGKGIYTTKETLKRTKPCSGKCGCDKENIVMKHSYAAIKIISPDVSSICPCPNSCLIWFTGFSISCFFNTEALNNIKVTVERVELHPDYTDSEASVSSQPPAIPEPVIEKQSISALIDSQYDTGTPEEEASENVQEEDDVSEWSFGIPVVEEEEEESEEDEDETPPRKVFPTQITATNVNSTSLDRLLKNAQEVNDQSHAASDAKEVEAPNPV